MLTGVDISKFPKKVNLNSNVVKLNIDKLKNVPINLSNLISKLDKLDTDELVAVPVYLSKQSVVVKNYVAKKDVYNAKVKNIAKKYLILLTHLLILLLMLK